ncbi:tautomerase family protein [Proteobacteria bacterium 005FR1]|nr:tautomerase family protein [Proteobacteria bacterium 005FR1]
MSQVKIYGISEQLMPVREQLSDLIHECIMDVLGLPAGKRAHRFFPMARENMFYPEGRTDAYTILEISMMAGRSVETRKRLVRTLFDRIEAQLGIAPNDLEICIEESPPCNWGFRGIHGDEAKLNYKISI